MRAAIRGRYGLVKAASLVLAFLTLTAVASARAPGPLLAPASASPVDVGGPSGQVMLVDWNRDGRLDLVTRHQQTRKIAVHVGDGRGGFRRSAATTATFSPGDMRLGDVNEDHVADLVVTAGARDLVDVLLGRVGRPFIRASRSPFAASTRTYKYNKRALHLVDITGEGHLDIVTANRRGQFAFRVLVGDGHAHFARGRLLVVKPAHEGYTLGFADVDADGDVDAVTAVSSSSTGRVAVHLGDGHGSFPRVRRVPGSLAQPYRIEAVADVNRDHRPDLLISHRHAFLSVLVNRGRGRFAPADGSPFAAPARLFAVVTADLDRDGKRDVVGATGNDVSVLLGDGRGGWRDHHSFRAGPGAYDVAVGDVNRDGKLDVVASSFESDAVTILLGR